MTQSLVVMIAAPGSEALDEGQVEALRAFAGGGPMRWLARGEAAEFALAAPADPSALRAAIGDLPVDIAVVPAAGRKKRLLLADMDSTIIGQECIDELADVAGVGPRVAEITARAMNGEIDFESALRERVGLLAGLKTSVLETVYADRIRLAPGARRLVATMRANGARAVLVSGGFTAFTRRVAAEVGFDEHRANRLLQQDGRLTGDVARPILGRAAKVAALEEVSGQMGIGPDAVVAVGDGANDLDMLGRAGLGVALHAKPAVAAQAPVRIDHGDLTALLYLQGFTRDEFAEPA